MGDYRMPLANISRILATLDRSTPEDILDGATWYQRAHEQCCTLAETHDLPLATAVGVVAVLSPSVSWDANLDAAIRLVAGEKTIPGYGANVAKARLLLATDDLSLVSGPKVAAFARALLAPRESLHEVVVDRHALAIWEGYRGGQVCRRHALIERDYQAAARLAGLQPRHLQAITWVTHRRALRTYVSRRMLSDRL